MLFGNVIKLGKGVPCPNNFQNAAVSSCVWRSQEGVVLQDAGTECEFSSTANNRSEKKCLMKTLLWLIIATNENTKSSDV